MAPGPTTLAERLRAAGCVFAEDEAALLLMAAKMRQAPGELLPVAYEPAESGSPVLAYQQAGAAPNLLRWALRTAFVLAAIKPWVRDVDAAAAERLLAVYEKELDDTFITYAGDPSLTEAGDYARIDGPSVWIEFAVQGGRGGGHYHTVWRDRRRDYGALFDFK